MGVEGERKYANFQFSSLLIKLCVLKFKSTDFLQILAKLLATFSKLNLCDVLRGSNWKRDNIKQGEGGAYYSFKSKPHTWIKASNVFFDCHPENYSVNRQLLFSRSHMSPCIYLSKDIFIFLNRIIPLYY